MLYTGQRPWLQLEYLAGEAALMTGIHIKNRIFKMRKTACFIKTTLLPHSRMRTGYVEYNVRSTLIIYLPMKISKMLKDAGINSTFCRGGYEKENYCSDPQLIPTQNFRS